MVILLFFLGLVFGSFAGAQVWRLRARQLDEDKAGNEVYDPKEYRTLRPLLRRTQKEDRSICLHCSHQLAWYDLIPLFSWVGTKGRCRYCKKRIGYFEPIIEIGTAVFFATSFVFWPHVLATPLEVTQFIIWLIIGVFLIILFAYDAKWFLLPDRIVLPAALFAAGFAGMKILQIPDKLPALISLLGALLIMSGLYLVIWLVSKGRWIGFGDVKLGVVLGLLVGQWELAFLALFLANFIGCLIVLPGLATKKMSRTTQVPFGPMLIVGTMISVLFGDQFIAWYLSATSTLML
jgi:prepilin signal peptidase PulO-like enzyme (type II secretory pathway)